jgi:hypothetical protein
MSTRDPRAEYERRLEARRAHLEGERARDRRVSNLRLLVFGAAILLGWLAWGPRALTAWSLLVPAIAFGALVVWHERVARSRDRAERAVRLYERSLLRLEGDLSQQPSRGARFVDGEHVYAADLDLFSEGSLFLLLNEARTPWGEQTLARWLKQSSTAEEIRARQGAVRALTPQLDLREDMALLGEDVEERTEEGTLIRWASRREAIPGWAKPTALALAVIGSAVLVGWGLDLLSGWFVLGAFAVSGAVGLSWRRKVFAILQGVDLAQRELEVLAGWLARFERERFDTGALEDPRLAELRAALDVDGEAPSACVAQLKSLVDRLHTASNQFFVPLALLWFWRSQVAFALEGWRRRVGPSLEGWLEVVGEAEALLSLSTYAYDHPDDPFPEILDEGIVYEGRGLGHPLLEDGGVRNDVTLGEEPRLLLVSGSNMSGKSTFLRVIGTNAVLAMVGAPVRATSLRMTPFALGATLRVQDSLQQGASRFYAEITRLKQCLDLADGEPPLLFFFDELLAGTNSHDRRIGAEHLIRGLVKKGAVGLVTTHDLALADIADTLGERARNVHFEDVLDGERVVFDYRLRDGVVEKSNALALMRAVGLTVEEPVDS